MNVARRFEEIGIIIPQIMEMSGTEQEIDSKIKELVEKMKAEFEKMVDYCITVCNITRTDIKKFEQEFLAKENFTKEELITDEKRWNELQTKWFQLNKQFFKLQSKLLHTGCDEYDMNYVMQSELFQFFHEDMDKRRERLEAPILRKIDNVNAEIARIDAEQELLTRYTITGNPDEIEAVFQKLFINMLPEKD